MNILFDCTSTQPEFGITVNGGGEYTTRILCEILKNDKFNYSLLFSEKKGKNNFIEDVAKNNNLTCYWYKNLNELSAIANDNFDILFFPILYPKYSELSIKDNVKIIGFILDLSMFYEYYLFSAPGEFHKRDGLDWLRYTKKKLSRKIMMKKYLSQHIKLFELNNNTSIYTGSYYSKYAIEYFCQKNVKEVYYCPINEIDVSFSEELEGAVLRKYGLKSKSYFLMVSASRWIKNNYMAIKSLDEMISDTFYNFDKEMKIIVLGCTNSYKNFLNKSISNKDRFVFDDFIVKNELNILYKNAYSFIYPSLLEGFGYPPIEAMKYNTVSICSTSTSIPEICGDSVIYFEPRNIDSFKMAVMRALDKEYYMTIKKRINNHFLVLKEKQENDLKRIIELL